MLKSHTVLLTGAAGGIGSVTAQHLAGQGAKLLLVDRDAAAIERVAEPLRMNGTEVRTKSVDITTSAGRAALTDWIREEGDRLDVLINCAGINHFALFSDCNEQAIDAMVAVNLTAPLQLVRVCLPWLSSSTSAHILNIGSTFGSIGYPGFAVYSATKFAIRGFTEALRRELSDTRIRVSYLAPRATKTSINTGPVYEMNSRLGVAMDDPSVVAREVISILSNAKGTNRYLGWPEKLFVRINSLLPSLVDSSLAKQLDTIRLFARIKST